MSVLDIKNLEVSINEKQILKGLNLEIKSGEIHAVMDRMELVNLH